MRATAYLLAKYNLMTGQLDGFGIYSETSPTTRDPWTYLTVLTVPGATYAEASDQIHAHLRRCRDGKLGSARRMFGARVLASLDGRPGDVTSLR